MAIAHVATGTAGVGLNSATTGAADGTGANLSIVCQTTNNGVAEPTPTDSEGNTYTGETRTSTGGFFYTRIWHSYNPTVSASMTASWSQATGAGGISLMLFSGAASGGLDQQGQGTTTSATSIASGSITPTENDELIVTMCSFEPAGTLSVDSSITLATQANYAGGVNYGTGCGYKIQTTAAAINATWSKTGTAGGMASHVASFKAAGGAVATYNYLTLLGVG